MTVADAPEITGHLTARASVLPLSSPQARDIARTGGKASRLSCLLSDGHPVPPGFVVTTDALDAFIAVLPDHAVQRDVLQRAMPQSLVAEIRSAYDEFGGRVAVRSSGVAEDLADASFAGQYESILDVHGADAVIDAVRQCVASAFAERIVAYRRERGIATTRMAVLVQRFVPAQAAGVAFTAHPVTGDRDVAVVSAIAGVGESLVSGEANAEEWEVRGGAAVRTRSTTPVLRADQVTVIADIARRVANGVPTDIEWAVHHDAVVLLQARPMTALPEPVTWQSPHPGAWLRNFRLGEWIGAPVTPLFETWLLHDLERGMHDRWTWLFGLPSYEPLHVIVNGWYFYGLNMPKGGSALRALTTSLGRMFGPHRAELLAAVPVTRAIAYNAEVARWRRDLVPAYRAAVADATQRVDRVSESELPAMIDGLIGHAVRQLSSIVNVSGNAALTERDLAKFCRTHAPSSTASWLELVTGAPVTPSAHDVEGLDWFFPTLGERGALPQSVSAARRAELMAQRDAATARVREQMPASKHRAFDALVAKARASHDVRQEQTTLLTLAWPVMRRAVQRIAALLVREGHLQSADDVYFLRRDELAACLSAVRSSAEGLNTSAGATQGTLHATLQATVRDRRATWERQRRLAPPLMLGELTGVFKKGFEEVEAAIHSDEHDAPDALPGMPGSPGRVTGVARVVRSIDELPLLNAGEILVAPVTTPGWTAAFASALAIVTDTGSIASHASIVAREYGIPAVVGTGIGTTRIMDGQRITVDGSRGVVRLGGGG
jgi:pyruvate,water dikinase